MTEEKEILKSKQTVSYSVDPQRQVAVAMEVRQM